jgi:hypothetical protein
MTERLLTYTVVRDLVSAAARQTRSVPDGETDDIRTIAATAPFPDGRRVLDARDSR